MTYREIVEPKTDGNTVQAFAVTWDAINKGVKLIRPGAGNEQRSEHRTWQAAYNAMHKHDDKVGHTNDVLEVVEQDRDGRRAYDRDGKVTWRE